MIDNAYVKKVIVIGSTGSGKSTFATALARQLNYPYIQLDRLFWKANWQNCDDEEFFQKILHATQGQHWVLDGNYSRTNHLTWSQANTIVWIDLPFRLTLFQNITRSLKRAITRQELWPNTDNRESLLRMFSKDSIVLWLFKTYKKNKLRYEQCLINPQYQNIKFHRLQSRRAIHHFLNQIQDKK